MLFVGGIPLFYMELALGQVRSFNVLFFFSKRKKQSSSLKRLHLFDACSFTERVPSPAGAGSFHSSKVISFASKAFQPLFDIGKYESHTHYCLPFHARWLLFLNTSFHGYLYRPSNVLFQRSVGYANCDDVRWWERCKHEQTMTFSFAVQFFKGTDGVGTCCSSCYPLTSFRRRYSWVDENNTFSYI